MPQQTLTWDSSSSQGFNFSQNDTLCIQNTSGGWTPYVRSLSDWTPTSGNILEWTFTSTGQTCGMGKDPIDGASQSYSDIEYGLIYDGSGTLYTINHGSINQYTGTFTPSMTCRITMTASAVTITIDGTTIFSHSNPTGGTYYAQFTSSSAVPSNFGATLDVLNNQPSGGSGGSGGSSNPPAQMYTSAGSTPHNENRPLQIFKTQRSWF